jgi:type III restriction enzyme
VLLEGIVGEGVQIGPDILRDKRPSEISFHLAKHLLYTRFRDPGEPAPLHLFGQIKNVVRRWVDEGYLVCKGGTMPAMLIYRDMAELAAEHIYFACQRREHGEKRIKAILDAYNEKGSSRHVNFTTSKPLYRTAPTKCQVNYVVTDSNWEAEMARVIESQPRVIAYVKNQGLQFEVPYRDGAVPRKYLPDFIVRVNDGRDEPLNLVVETKGFRGDNAQLKAETMRTLWVPGVNNLGTFGRWQFAEFTDPFDIEAAFGRLVDSLLVKEPA